MFDHFGSFHFGLKFTHSYPFDPLARDHNPNLLFINQRAKFPTLACIIVDMISDRYMIGHLVSLLLCSSQECLLQIKKESLHEILKEALSGAIRDIDQKFSLASYT